MDEKESLYNGQTKESVLEIKIVIKV